MPIIVGQDTAKTRRDLSAGGSSYAYYSIDAAQAAGLGDFSRLPAALKVVLENLLRFEDGKTVSTDDVKAFAEWARNGGKNPREIAYRPARVLMQDFTGVPAVVDLAAMRDGIVALGGDAEKINPLNPVDLVIDHSVMIDEFGNPRAFQMNVDREYERNMERYTFLKWGQSAFDNFRVVPPGTGICHQVNLEYLAQTAWTDTDQNGDEVAYPDTLVGTDSHTTMVNGLAVLGWGVGGIEAEAAMLGQPISMLIPEVIGFELTGGMVEGTTATDLVLKVVQMLREKGVVGKFVEFYGKGLDNLPLADRATIANMAPEYGATCGFFPVDGETLRYLRQTGRSEERIALVEAYAKAQGMWRGDEYAPVYTDTLTLDMGTIIPAISGPKRPQDFLALTEAKAAFAREMEETFKRPTDKEQPVEGEEYTMSSGKVVIASITSCTNTSNPYVMIGAGLVARKARELGLDRKPWVKTSLAPGSQVVSDYLEAASTEVTVVEYLDHITPGMDAEVTRNFQKILQKQGLKFVLGAAVSGVKATKTKAKLQYKLNADDSEHELEADIVLVATGRKPYTEGLGLAEMAVEVTERGQVKTDAQWRTNVPGIFAIGDVIEGPMLAHKAEDEGVAVAEAIAGQHGHVNYDVIPGVIYTSPEVATVGLNEEQLKAAGREFKVGKFPFMANGRAKANHATDGFVKILADAQTDRVLGCHVIGPAAGDLIHEICVAMEFGAAAEDIARTCHAHPTFSEAMREAAMACGDGPIHS